MFEISELKAKKLTDLQTIAKSIGLQKTSQLKKLDLVYKILDAQAEASANKAEVKPLAEKSKRKRISKTETTEAVKAAQPVKKEEAVREEKKNVERKPIQRKPAENKIEDRKSAADKKPIERKRVENFFIGPLF